MIHPFFSVIFGFLPAYRENTAPFYARDRFMMPQPRKISHSLILLAVDGTDIFPPNPLLCAETGGGINYALKKKTQQSSTYELYGIHYTSDKAVDGSHNTEGLKPPYFAHTADSYWNELFPWWMVDLAQDITVTGVRIRNRKEWGKLTLRTPSR